MYESTIGKAMAGEITEELATELTMLHTLVCHHIFCPGYRRECGKVMDSRKSTIVTFENNGKSVAICDGCSDILKKAINREEIAHLQVTDARLYKTDGTLKKKPKKKQEVKSNTLTLLFGGKD